MQALDRAQPELPLRAGNPRRSPGRPREDELIMKKQRSEKRTIRGII